MSAESKTLDLSDLVEEALDAPRAVSSRPALAAATTPSLPHEFCMKLRRLLLTLADVFPERGALTTWLTFIDHVVLGKAPMEEWAIKRWHKEMTMEADETTPRVPNMYELTASRRISEVFDAKIWVFEEIDGRSMYNDPSIDAEDRELICKHFDGLNETAQLYSTVPADMLEKAQEVYAELDPTKPVTLETIQYMTQKLMGCGPDELTRDPAGMEKMFGWARHFTSTFAGTDMSEAPNPAGMLDMLTKKGGPLDTLESLVSGGLGASCDVSVRNMVQVAAEGLRESRTLLASGSPADSETALKSVMEALSSIGGGAGAGAGSAGSGSAPASAPSRFGSGFK